MLKKLVFLFFCSLLALPSLAATASYADMVQDIEGRLDRAVAAYQGGDIENAKMLVQNAYFEVFENLEGSIRINVSARQSADMEAAFGDIRRLIMAKQPLPEINNRVNWLKAQLQQVLPTIEAGHRLKGEDSQGAYANPKINPYWHDSYRLIDDLLAESVSLYQGGQLEQAQEKIRRAQFEGFKNSNMESIIRSNRSATQAQELSQAFVKLVDTAGQSGQITKLGYGISQLLQDIEAQMEDLPIPASAQAMADNSQTSNTDWARTAADINTAVAQALAQHQAGQSQQAIAALQNAYFDIFEASGMESRIGARDNGAKLTLEGHFTRLSSLIKANRPEAELQAEAQALAADLTQAVTQLGGSGQTWWSLALISLVIILREGIEALLIVAAIVAYLVKNGHQDKLPMIRQSVVAALAASVLTAAAFYWLFQNAGAQRELLEGFTMMAAVVVLFSMSYWLLSKAEAAHWKAYLEGKISVSLTKGSLFGLWFASFLAVYREGAETVLFYQALLVDSSGLNAYLSLLAGFVVGCLLLLVAYFVMRLSVVRLPLRPFFLFTGGFMYLMAFIFAGNSVMELIEGKLFQPTLWSWVPELSLLGIHPYRETLLPQLALLLAAAVALWVLKRQRIPATRPPAAKVAAPR